jgi:hypothetical protein
VSLPPPPSTAIERAILRTVAYSDVFDYAPSADEVHRYLDTTSATAGAVRRAIDGLVPGWLCADNDAVALAGREELLALRRRRLETARRLWPAAVRWGRALGRLPFARMVALTGALAVDNVEPGADLDYLIVTEPGRVWLCRSLAIQTVRVARLRGLVLCPNWLLAADALELERHDLFVARNLVQMVPLAGVKVYRRMREANAWTRTYLPNADGPPRPVTGVERARGLAARGVESLLRTGIGSTIEGWERRRKRREILARSGSNPELVLDRRQCKGHVDAHGQKVLHAYAERLQALGLVSEGSADLASPEVAAPRTAHHTTPTA